MRDGIRHRGGPPGVFFGLLIITLGVIFFLDQQGIFPAREAFHFFWAAIIIFWGVQILMHAQHGSGHIWGGLMVLFGAVLVANEVGFLHVRIGSLWPVVLIVFGIWMLLGATGRLPARPSSSEWHGWRGWSGSPRSSFNPTEGPAGSGPAGSGPASSGPASPAPDSGDAEFNQTAIFTGFKRRITSQHFKYGKVATVFGGFNIDLTRADMDGNQAVVHIDSVFGGGEIRVPDTWNVQIEGSALAGAFVDETYPKPVDARPLKNFIVRGSVVFGGVVIKN